MSSTPLTGGIGTAQYGDEGFGDPYLLPNKTFHPGPLIERVPYRSSRVTMRQGRAALIRPPRG